MRVGFYAKALCTVVAIFAAPSAPVAQVQINQNFIAQGPAPTFGPFEIMGSADAANGTAGTATGAVQAILVDPILGSDTIFVGATSGGVWKSADGGSTWSPLTDNQSILSIASLGLDASDHTGQTLIAGAGITSSGGWSPALSTSGDRPLLYSTDGGEQWAPLAGSTAFADQNVVGVAANGETIMAATFDQACPTCPNHPANPYGLYRSVDGGTTFTLANNPDEPISSLPAGPVTALVADKSDPTHATYYAGVTSPTDTDLQGVYVTRDSGETWQPFFTKDTTPDGGENILATEPDKQFVFRLATAPNDTVAISVIGDQPSEIIDDKPCTLEKRCAKLKGLYSGTSAAAGSASWTALQPPDTNSDGGALYKAGLAIDPNSSPDSPIVYVSGDYTNVSPTFPSPVFRVPNFCTADAVENCSTSLICELNSDGVCITGSTPTGAAHADSRALALDSAGNLLLVGDGGAYKLTDPQKDNGVWSGLNTTLQVHEPYQIGYGGYAKRLVVAAQDTGVALQSEPNSPLYTPLQGFDGYVALARDVSDESFADRPVSVYYTSSYYLDGLTRLILDGNGNVVNPDTFDDLPDTSVGVPVSCTLLGETNNCGFITDSEWNSVVLNRFDQKRLAFVGEFGELSPAVPTVYVTTDTAPASAESVNLDLIPLGPVPGTVLNIRMAYGALDNPNALLVGAQASSGSGSLPGSLLLTKGASSPLQEVTAYNSQGGQIPLSLVFGMNDENFYVVDGFSLWGKKAGETDFTNYASELSHQGVTGPSSVEFINNNGVDALLVGGLMSCPSGVCDSSQSPIAVADSNNVGDLHNWRLFGAGLPNALVYDMSYNSVADVLSVAGVGRGVWNLYDVTSHFAQAEVLQFGLADNDSLPDASYLTDGTQLDGTSFVRPLAKYGSGRLTVAGDATYTGFTTIFDGILQLGSGGESGSILGDVGFCADTIDPLNGLKVCNPSVDKFLVFDRSDTYSFDGAISGPGQLVQNGPGTTVLTAFNTYTGPTTVNEGALIVNGSIASDVTVNNGGLLGGSGSVGATSVLRGGTIAPGNSIGTMTVNGNLMLNPGAIYEAEVDAGGANDKIIVNGTVNLTGATLQVLAANGNYKPSTGYTIIENDGDDAVTGEFSSVTTSLAFLTPFVSYDGGDGNDVVLSLIRNDIDLIDVATTRNQRAVAVALDRFALNDPLFLAVLNQTAGGARQAFDALSGEVHATVAGTLADDSRYTREAVLGRLMQATHGNNNPLSANGPQVASLYDDKTLYDGKSLAAIEPERAPLAFWTQGFGAWGDYDSDGNAASASRDLGGFISGIDVDIGGSWRAGLATGASFSSVDINARTSSADVETYHLGGYVGGMVAGFALRGGGLYAWNSVDTSRAVIFPGFFERQNASYDADTGQLFGEIAYPTQMGGIALEPFGGLAFVSVDTDNFRERGGALASLRGEADQDVGYTTLGLRAATTMQWGNTQVTPHIAAAWQHAFDDVTPGASFVFASNGIGFGVNGVPLAENSALLDAGLDFALGENGTAGVSYSGQYGDGVSDNAVRGRVTWLF